MKGVTCVSDQGSDKWEMSVVCRTHNDKTERPMSQTYTMRCTDVAWRAALAGALHSTCVVGFLCVAAITSAWCNFDIDDSGTPTSIF